MLHVLSEPLPWPGAASRDWVVSFAGRACSDPNTRALLLIGSIARNVRQCTDVDLLYIYVSQPLSVADHPLEVDIRQYSATSVEDRIAQSQDVMSWSLRFGRLICEHEEFWTTLERTWSGRLPLPNPDVAEQRAHRAAEVYEQLREMGDADAALEQRVTLLTHRAWARLLRAGVHPASRPELPQQLNTIGEVELGTDLANALRVRARTDHERALQPATR